LELRLSTTHRSPRDDRNRMAVHAPKPTFMQ
jgi:hypothetical protein